jgi:hypothetical protein
VSQITDKNAKSWSVFRVECRVGFLGRIAAAKANRFDAVRRHGSPFVFNQFESIVSSKALEKA